MVSPFEIVKALNEKTTLEYDLKDYEPWMINKIMSNHKDTLFFADFLNNMHHLPKQVQHDFYKYGIPKGKRFGEWFKPDINTNIDIVMEFYNVNRRVAESYVKLLTDSDIEKIKTKMNKGGKS